ncbi:MAG: hypothetical protein MRZ79_27195 [Bacteroidia bacterium]|nr:hypothetical protein [Bacteroidia bacterium]
MENPSILAAIVGVSTGVISAFFTHIFQLRFERRKNQIDSKYKWKNEFKKELANTVQTIMEMIQEVSWVAWEVSKKRGEKSEAYLQKYNASAKQKRSLISKQLAMIAASDRDTFKKMREVATIADKLELEFADSLVDYVDGNLEEEVFGKKLKVDAKKAYDELPEKFIEVLKFVDTLD